MVPAKFRQEKTGRRIVLPWICLKSTSECVWVGYTVEPRNRVTRLVLLPLSHFGITLRVVFEPW